MCHWARLQPLALFIHPAHTQQTVCSDLTKMDRSEVKQHRSSQRESLFHANKRLKSHKHTANSHMLLFISALIFITNLTFLHLVNSAACCTAFTNVTMQSILITRVLSNKESPPLSVSFSSFLYFTYSSGLLFSFSSYWSAAFVKAIKSLRNIWNDQSSI